MKKKLKGEIREKTAEQLVEELRKKREEIAKLRIDVGLAKVKDTSLLKRKQDDLAVMETILEEKKFS